MASHWIRVIDDYSVRNIAALLLVGFGIAGFYSRDLAFSICGILLFLLLLVIPIHAKKLRREPLTWLALLYVLWITVSAYLLANRAPDMSEMVWKQAGMWYLTGFLVVFPVIFWAARTTDVVRWFGFFLVLGYLFRIILMTDVGQLSDLLSGIRSHRLYGEIRNHFAFNSLIVILAAATSLAECSKLKNGWLKLCIANINILAIPIAFFMIILSQTRSVWICTILLSITLASLYIREAFKHTHRLRYLSACLFIFVILGGIVATLFADIVAKRLVEHGTTISKVISGNWHDLEYNSVGYRVRLYEEGFSVWLDKPLLGHGPGIERVALSNADDEKLRDIYHFHNGYLDVLVTYGLIGFAIFLYTGYLIAQGALSGYRAGYISKYNMIFVLTSGAALCVFWFFEQSLRGMHMPFLLSVMAAIALSWRFNIILNDN